jgi:hypothetical protein
MFRWEGVAFQVYLEEFMVQDDHVGCLGAGSFEEHDQREVFAEGSKRDGRDSCQRE